MKKTKFLSIVLAISLISNMLIGNIGLSALATEESATIGNTIEAENTTYNTWGLGGGTWDGAPGSSGGLLYNSLNGQENFWFSTRWNSASEGKYFLTVRYSKNTLAGAGSTLCEVQVNGVNSGKLLFNPTSGSTWDAFAYASIELSLVTGLNTIKLVSSGMTGVVMLDTINVSSASSEINSELVESSMYSTMIRGAKYPSYLLMKNLGTTTWDTNSVELVGTGSDTVTWLQFGGFNVWNDLAIKNVQITGSTATNAQLKLDFGVKMPDIGNETVFAARVVSKTDGNKVSSEIRKNIMLRDITKEDLKSAVLEAESAFNKVTFVDRTGAIDPSFYPYVVNWIASGKNALALVNPTTQELLTGYNDLYNALSVILKQGRVPVKDQIYFDATLKNNNFPSEMVVGETYNLEFTYESNSYFGFLWGTYGLYKFGLKAGSWNQFNWDGVGEVHPANPAAIFTKKYMDDGVLVDNGQRYTFKFSVTAPDAPTQKCLEATMFNDYNGSEQYTFGDYFFRHWFFINAKDKTALSKLIAENNSLITNAKIGTTGGYYSQASVDTLNAAIAVAQGVYDNSSATADGVILAYNTLRDARNTFKASVVPATFLDYEVVSHNIPDKMGKGEIKDAFITIKNVGIWNLAPKHGPMLAAYSTFNDIEFIDGQFGGIKNSNDNQQLFFSKTADINEIKPGELYTFRFKLKAPTDRTTSNFSVRGINLAYPGLWFGQNLQKTITLTPNKDDLITLKTKITEFLNYTTIGSGVGEFTVSTLLDDLNNAVTSVNTVLNNLNATSQEIETAYNNLLTSYNATRASANPATVEQNSKVVAHNIPDTMINGESKEIFITFKNLGQWGWSNSYNQILAAYAANGLEWSNFENGGRKTVVTDQWAYFSSSKDVPNAVGFGELYTFRFTITAPISGTALWFDASLANIALPQPFYGERFIKMVNFIQPMTAVATEIVDFKLNLIKNIADNLTETQFLQLFNEQGISLSNLTAQSKVKTGSVASIVINGATYTKTIVVAGDTDGDGVAGLNDLANIRDSLLEISSIDGIYLEAADLYDEGKVTLNDLVGMMAYISESGSIVKKKLTNFYVDYTNGNDSFSGSIEAPWKTLSKVSSTTFLAGDTISLKSGEVWNESVTLSGQGTQSAPITLTSYGTGDKPLIRSSADTVVGGTNVGGWTVNGLAIECTSADAINVGGQNTAVQFTYTGTGSYSNLSITNNEIFATNGIDTNTNGIRILTLSSSDITSRVLTNLNINNNLVYNIGWLGIASTGWNTTLNRDLFSRNLYGNVNVIDNTVHNTAIQGITMHSLDDGFINNNLVYNCGQYTGTNVDWGTSGIWVMLASNVDITYNEVYGQSESNFKNYDASGFDIDWTCENINLSYNYAHDNKGPGIETMSSKNCTITFNTLSGNNGLSNVGNGQITLTSSTVNADAMTGLTGLIVSDNIITVDKPNTVALCTNLFVAGIWTGNNFTNNKITLASGVDGIGVYNLGANTDINTDNNTIYSSSGTTFVGTKNGTTYNSIEAWRIGTDLDMNSTTMVIQ